MSSPAVRALLGVAIACGSSTPSALPVTAIDTPVAESFARSQWPAPQWVEPQAFVVAGLRALGEVDTVVDKVALTPLDAGDRHGLLLTLLLRLALEAEAGHEPSMFDLEVDPLPSAGEARLAAVPVFGHAAKPRRPTLLLRPGNGSLPGLEPERPPQLDAAWNDLVPVRPLGLLPWIAVVLALLATAWIGWRTAARDGDAQTPAVADASTDARQPSTDSPRPTFWARVAAKLLLPAPK